MYRINMKESENEGLLNNNQQQQNNIKPNELNQKQRHLEGGDSEKAQTERCTITTNSNNIAKPTTSSASKKATNCWNCFRSGKKYAANSMMRAGAWRGRQPRLVDKEGECIIRPNNLQGSFSICLRNWFHLVIEHSWRRIFLLFSGSFLCSWFTFGLIYYSIQHFSANLQNLSEQHQCIANVHSLTSAFLFSLESQHTIGYGTRYMTESCPLAYIALSLQCIVGVLLQTILAGIVIAKILRPKKRKQEMRFSQCAVIGPVDDEDQRPALMIRLADIQHKLYIAESHVRLYMATTKINNRGECELIGVQDMNVGYDTGMDRVLLLWPVVIRHIIDQDSPLWEITEEKLRTCQFELIMTVEGIVEATGMAFQARSSFLPDEIHWAKRFVPMMRLNTDTNQFEVDYNLFDVTEPHPLETWLHNEYSHEQHEEEYSPMPHSTKLSVISELNSIAIQNQTQQYTNYNNNIHGIPNGVPLPPPTLSEPLTASFHIHHSQHHHNHHLIDQQHQASLLRRKSTCSIADSIRSGKIMGNNTSFADEKSGDNIRQRKSSRGSLLHVLLRRTQTNDSSPLVGNNGTGNNNNSQEENDECGGERTGGVLSSACSPLPPLPPASPYVVHTLQHSGFT
uniref:Uncharacterized protein n=1 Tax=Meloidogyne enterolobii TaxID=390850 RepID=A0A6V7WIF9_MELEN|nr:unnamed protein product [Meloidogyne enterolobii]